MLQLFFPTLHHRLDLAAEALVFLGCVLDAAARGFVVIEFGERRPEIEVTGGADFQAEVDVVEGDGEVFLVEAADLVENLFADEETGGSDGAVVLDEAGAVEDAFGAAVEIAERVAGDAAEADDDAGVLHGVVRIVEHRADTADLGAQGLRDHLVEPVGVDDFEVVVEEAEDGALGLLGGEIVDRAVIERCVVGDDPDGRFFRDLFEIRQRRRIIGAVVDDEDFVVRIRGLREDAVHAALEELEAVARGDEERNHRGLRGQRVFAASSRL